VTPQDMAQASTIFIFAKVISARPHQATSGQGGEVPVTDL